MFDELKPDQIPAPPSGALPEAIRRGTGIRRRRRAAWATGVAAVVVLVAAVVLGGPFGNDKTASVVPATATPTVPPDYSPIPATPSESDGISFGFLDRVTTTADGTVKVRIQPGYFLNQEEAKAANGGEVPIGEVEYGEDEDLPPAEFTIDPQAPLEGCCSLIKFAESTSERQPVTLSDLVRNYTANQSEQTDTLRALVWFRLADDRATITALAEQYTS
jgi:hypothetical protein